MKEMWNIILNSDVTRVMSASRNGLLMDDLVPRMHMMDDRTAANDSLHLSQLITTGYGFFCKRLWLPVPSPSGGENERCEDPALHITNMLAISLFLDVLVFLVGRG